MLSFDHHTHHERCGHARGRIEDYIQAALALGMTEIGISDHSPLYWREGDHPQPGSAMPRSALGEYVEEVLRLKHEYRGRIRVLLGMETDYVEGMEETYRAVREAYPWDYWIGSVHYTLGHHIYDRNLWNDRTDPEPVYSAYYRLIRKSAESGLFDILGHISGITVHGPKPDPRFLSAEFDLTAKAIAQAGVAVEINASGLRKGTGAPFPHPELLRRCLDERVPLTYGSDCHMPEEVGHARTTVAPLLSEATLWRPKAGA